MKTDSQRSRPSRTRYKAMLTAGIFLSAILVVLAITHAAPANSYDGKRLGDCPDSPNCVCSEMKSSASAYVEPFAIPAGVAPGDAFSTLVGLVEQQAKVAAQMPGYLHAVYTTRWFRFQDDFEARLDADTGVIHVRSASRLGHSDFGKNAARVKKLRTELSDTLRKERVAH